MKNLYSSLLICLGVFFALSVSAQQGNKEPIEGLPSFVKPVPADHQKVYNGSNLRTSHACDSTLLPIFYPQSFNDNAGFVWQLHEDYSHDFSLNWMAVDFTPLVDIAGVRHNYADWLVTVDSIQVPVYHMNQSGNNDYLIVKIVTLNASDEPTNNILWSDTLVTNTSLTGHFQSASGVYVARFAPEFKLPYNTEFGVRFEYDGPTTDTLWSIVDYIDVCSGNCFAAPSPFVNSYFDFNHSAVGGLQSTNNHTFYYDCNGNSTADLDSTNCETPPLQEARILTYVTLQRSRVSPSPSDTTICAADSARLNANASTIYDISDVTYQWTPSAGLSDPTVATPLFDSTSGAIYKVVATDSSGCQDSALVNVNVITSVNANAGTDTTICQGTSATLNPSGGNSYMWLDTSGTLSCTNCKNPVATPTYNTSYKVVAYVGSCSDTDSVVVTISPPPVANVAFGDTAICNGSSIQLMASGVGGGGSYAWSPSGSLDDSTLSDPIASPSSTTTYGVTVTDNNGCTDDTSVDVTVNPLPNFTIQTNPGPPPVSICKNKDVNLFVNAGFAGYNWYPDFGDLSCTNCNNPVFNSSNAGTYVKNVDVTDANGCTKTDSVKITVAGSPPSAFFSVSKNNLTITCDNNASGDEFKWTFGDGNGLPFSTDTSSVNHTYASGGTYTVTLIARNGCGNDTLKKDVTVVSGIEDVSLVEKSLSIYPNPTNGQVTLGFKVAKQTDVKVDVYDVTGRKVISQRVENVYGTHKQQLNLDNYPNGVYSIKITTDEAVVHRKIVNQ